MKEEENVQKEEKQEVTKTKSNPVNKVLLALVIVLILGFGFYICYDQGIIFKDKDNKESKSSEKKGEPVKPSDKDSKDKDDDKDSKDKDGDKKDDTISYPTKQSTCKYDNDQNNDTSITKCTLGKYSYEIEDVWFEEGENSGYHETVKNGDGKVIAKYDTVPEELVNRVAINDDGTIAILDATYSEEGYNYTLYSYQGVKQNKPNNYEKVSKIIDNYVLVIKNDHVRLKDYKGNYVKGFDFNLENGRYSFHSALSGWFTENGKNGVYIVIEDTKKEFGTIGAGLEYYFEPSTGKIDTIKTEGVGGYAKPVLYLYPKKDKSKIVVTFEKPKKLTTTYPKYVDKWEVTANKNGDLTDSKGNYYYGLYWEEKGSTKVDFKQGYYVTKDDAISFLEEKLKYIGLTDRERNEFIMYWLPVLEKNKKSVVYFELTEEREAFNKLNISPKPDSLLRLAIHIKKVDKKPKKLEKQKLSNFKRKGFVAVEWGGQIHK